MYIDWKKPLLFLTFEHAKGSTRTSKALSASWEGISPARPRTAWQDNVTLWKRWNVRYEKNLKIEKKKRSFVLLQSKTFRWSPFAFSLIEGTLSKENSKSLSCIALVEATAIDPHLVWHPCYPHLANWSQCQTLSHAFLAWRKTQKMFTACPEPQHVLGPGKHPIHTKADSYIFLPHRPWHQIPCLKGKRCQHRAALGTRGLPCAMQWPNSADSTSHSARHQDTSQISKTLRCTGLVPWPSILASGPTSTIVRDASDEGSYWGRNSSIRQKQRRHVLGIKEATARPRFTFVLLKNLIWVRVLPSKTGCVPRAACSPVRSGIPKLQMQTAE